MKIQSLTVVNFRAITRLELRNLPWSVVIAGPNGCGKSCVFDAIRLLKSVYGGYQPNEWQSWFGEFQININQRQSDLLSLFQDRRTALEVSADIVLAPAEVEFLRREAAAMLKDQAWKEVAPETARWQYINATPLASQLRTHEPEVEQRAGEALPGFLGELEQPVHRARFTIGPDAVAETARSRVLEVVFSVYDPQHVGIIDYHGPHRNYGRERIGGINLNIESSEQRLRQSALYNYANKYANLKSEMAGGYIRQVLAEKANAKLTGNNPLTETLKELFATFFPGKEFLGPQPTEGGGLLFPVRTPSGSVHDIDELSSGEKEVLYGYLRLRNASPRNSVLLIDEPELHLNPRLVSGLASFYHRHLGRALDSQVWLVTHSDTLIREAVGQKDFAVYQMQPPGQYEGENQATLVQASEDLDRVIIDLVGDLAAYRPGAKIVIFEGGGDSEFDVRMSCSLFPDFRAAVNAISGGDRRRVADLYEVLERVRRAGHLPVKVYAVTDSDGSEVRLDQSGIPTYLQWDAYHIENYLLEPKSIGQVLEDLNAVTAALDSEGKILDALRVCADQTIPQLVAHRLRLQTNKAIVQCIDLGIDPSTTEAATAISEAVVRSQERINRVVESTLRREALEGRAEEFRRDASSQLVSNKWLKTFRGRDILRRFVGTYGQGVRYETFRDLIIARMRDAEFRPPGMRTVLEQILKDPWSSRVGPGFRSRAT